MDKIKLSYLIYFIAGISVIILGISAYKAEKNHEEKLYHVVYSKIKETALDCYLNGDCEGDITLNVLYQKEYLTPVYDPVTKEELDNEICITYNDKEVDFCS